MPDEFQLIERIAGRFGVPEHVSVGIGDDAAVLAEDRAELVAMDTLVEGVHFRRDYSSGADVGWKLLAANLSDIAAMGGRPKAFFLSLAIPGEGVEQWLDDFGRGLQQAALKLTDNPGEVSAAGGDLSSTDGPIVATLTLLGQVSPAEPLLRCSASPGDLLVVSGVPGRSAAGLAVLDEHSGGEREFPELVKVHRRPRPPVQLARRLALQQIPSAMIDVSDGLIQDLGHLLEASDVGACVELSRLDVPPSLERAAEAGLGKVQDWICGGGEDFCLLMTVPASRLDQWRRIRKDRDVPLVRIGRIEDASRGLVVTGLDGRQLQQPLEGFRHFEER